MLIVAVGFYIENTFYMVESFANDTRDADVNKYVSKIYLEILDRYPSASEAREQQTAILAGKRSFDDVRQRLTDSDEYKTKIKMQSNSLVPELPKMISDSKLLRNISQIYLDERKKTVPSKLVLPLKDIFIHLDYNENALRYMLRMDKWNDLENEIMIDPNFTKEKLDILVSDVFGGYDKVLSDSESNKLPEAGNVNDKIDRMIQAEDTDMTALINDIHNQGVTVISKSNSGNNNVISNTGTGMCMSQQDVAVRPHYGDMVLRPEFAWSVPQPRAPVCTTLGKASLIQPVVLQSSLALNATSLEDASDTAVGSIMPNFRYKEYVQLNVKEKCAPSKGTS